MRAFKRAVWLCTLALLSILAIIIALIQLLFTKGDKMVQCPWCNKPVATSDINRFKHKKRSYCCSSHVLLARKADPEWTWKPVVILAIVIVALNHFGVI